MQISLKRLRIENICFIIISNKTKAFQILMLEPVIDSRDLHKKCQKLIKFAEIFY